MTSLSEPPPLRSLATSLRNEADGNCHLRQSQLFLLFSESGDSRKEVSLKLSHAVQAAGLLDNDQVSLQRNANHGGEMTECLMAYRTSSEFVLIPSSSMILYL